MSTPSRRRTLGGAVLAGALLVAGLSGGAALAAPQPSPGTPSPTCPPGRTMTRLATPAVPGAVAHPAPGATAVPGGGTARTVCLPDSPTPQPAPVVAAAHVVGGPDLARSGIVTDLPAGVPAPPDVPHRSYVLADLDTGQILAAKNAHAWLRPASTLKLLTALVVIPALSPSTVVIGAPEDTAADGTRVGIVVGGRYTVDDLLNAMLLPSANDAAYALARAYGGRARTIADMHTEAARLGAFDTVAVDPSGLDADGQRSSAYDLALFGRAVMGLADFRRRALLRTASFPGGLVTPTGTTGPRTPTQGPPYEISNHNPLLPVYPGVIGVKSGYTSAAANTLVVAATRGGRTLLLAEMGSPEQQSVNTPALLDWGFAYAARVTPVGRLVDPGTAAAPPELAVGSGGPGGSAGDPAGGSTAPDASGAGSTDSSATADEEDSTDVVEPATAAALAASAGGSSAGPLAWWSGLPDVARWSLLGLVVLLAAGVALVVRAVRHRPRGAYQR